MGFLPFLSFLLLLIIPVGSRLSVPSKQDGQLEIASTSPADLSKFNLLDLKNLIDRNHVTSIEQLLPLLPEDLRQNFTLVKKSESLLQDGSPLNPRVVLFGSTGKLMLTFNGSPEQRGYNALEILAFDDARNKFELRELEFSDAHPPRWSSANPAKCVACHTSTPKPIWSSYSEWPGVYGSNDDNFGETEDILKIKKMPEFASTKELKEFRAFKATVETHPRYKSLKWEKDDVCFPYNCSLFAEKNLVRSPNFRLTFLAVLNNAKSLAEVVTKSFNYQSYKYTFLRLAVCTPRGVNDSLRLSDLLASMATLPSEELFFLSKEKWTKEVFEEEAFLSYVGIPYGSSSLGLRIDLFPGYSSSSLHSRGAYTATGLRTGIRLPTSTDNHGQVSLQILRKVAQDDPELRKILNENSGWAKSLLAAGIKLEEGIYVAPSGFRAAINEDQALVTPTGAKLICDHLLPKSEAEIARNLRNEISSPTNFSDTQSPGVQILTKNNCIACHQHPPMKAAPQIPFADPKAFAEYVRLHDSWGLQTLDQIEKTVAPPQHPRHLSKMPISGRGLTKEEVKILMDYLHSISKP